MRLFGFIFLFFIFFGHCLASEGDTAVEGKSKKGVRYGSWTYYDSQRHILKVEHYRHGSVRKTFIFNQAGHVIERINRKGVVTKLRACGC